MFDIHNYSSFIMAIVVFQLIPGAGTIAILNATARNGVGVGMCAVLGTLTGDCIYMLAAVLGLAAVLSAYPGVLAAAQWIGVCYLCLLGVNLLRASAMGKSPAIRPEVTGWLYYRQALAVCLTNPKAILFFMAFFPLFLGEDSKVVTLIIMMAHVTFLSFIYQTFLVLAGNAVARKLSKWEYARVAAARLAGIALVAFSVKLASSIK